MEDEKQPFPLCTCPFCKAATTHKGWRSVEESLPEVPGKYLVFRPDTVSDEARVRIEYFNGSVDRPNYGFGPGWKHKLSAARITHWMPLPSPPLGDDNAE